VGIGAFVADAWVALLREPSAQYIRPAAGHANKAAYVASITTTSTSHLFPGAIS
jgi:hypothetical protein